MCFVELALPPGFFHKSVERGIDRVNVQGALAMVVLRQKEQAIVRSDIPIDSARFDRFTGPMVQVLEKVNRAGRAHAQAMGIISIVWIGPSIAANRIVEIAGSCFTRSRRLVIQLKGLLIELV